MHTLPPLFIANKYTIIRYVYYVSYMIYTEAFICTAHHKEDQVETILMQLIRGSHISSMQGVSVGYIDCNTFIIYIVFSLCVDENVCNCSISYIRTCTMSNGFTTCM